MKVVVVGVVVVVVVGGHCCGNGGCGFVCFGIGFEVYGCGGLLWFFFFLILF